MFPALDIIIHTRPSVLTLWRSRFYKESLAGEEGNYILNRSIVHNKSPIDVLADVAEEASAAHTRVSKALEIQGTPEAYTAWIAFTHGYL